MIKHCQCALLFTLVTALLLPGNVLSADAHLSGRFEGGVEATEITDDVKRVNEYPTISSDEEGTVQGYGKISAEANKDGVFLEGDAEIHGGTDRNDLKDFGLDVDLNRILRYEGKGSTMQHWVDHDLLDYMNATMKPTNTNPATIDTAKDKNPSIASDDTTPEADFMITRREYENKAELALPNMPNVTLHAGYRIEEREGLEQANSMSKCAACHVEGEAKRVNERTRDYSVGATGKFGLLTVEYAYEDRSFTEKAAPPTYRVDVANAPDMPYPSGNFDSRLLYDYPDELPYEDTPDSDKTTHKVKARVDMSRGTELVGSFVQSEVESDKVGDVSYSLNQDSLSIDYTGYGAKFKTNLTSALTFSLSGKAQEVDGEDYTVNFVDVGGTETPIDFSSEGTRDELNLKANLKYRLARGHLLRLGYEYEDIDREHGEELGETDSQLGKVAYSGRFGRKLKLRGSYAIESIDDPFHNSHAANVPLTYIEGSTGTPGGVALSADSPLDLRYGVAFYDRREDDLTNRPEDVNEAKISSTWTPSARFSTTVYARYREEEGDKVNSAFSRTIMAPGASFWYAPNGGLNLTMAYNFNRDEVENKMCVGWYHG